MPSQRNCVLLEKMKQTIAEIVSKRPNCLAALKIINGIGPKSLERYGTQIIDVILKYSE